MRIPWANTRSIQPFKIAGIPNQADSMRFYRRPMPSPDGARVAVTVREYHIDVWRADGL